MESLEELLAGRYIATLATRNADGSTSLAAVWFLWRAPYVYVSTDPTSRKARNAAARPEGAILVDARTPAPYRGATASGSLAVLAGEEALAVNELVWRKYLTPAGLAEPQVGGAIRATDVVTVRLEPAGWRTWSTGDDFDGAFERPGIAWPLDG